MGLPLQADTHPQPYWYRRLLAVLIGISCVLILGIIQGPSIQAAHSASQVDHAETILLGNQQHLYLQTLSQHIEAAQQRIWCMIYVVRLGENTQHPVNYIADLLVQAKQRGVDVRIVTDQSDPESTYPGPDNSECLEYFSQHKIPVFLDEIDKTTHAKAIIIDDHVFIGSHNWTNWALTKNREYSVLSYDPAVLNQMSRAFLQIPQFKLP